MNRIWLREHRQALILLVAGTLAALSIATVVANETQFGGPNQPTLNGGDAEESEEPEDVDEAEDAEEAEDANEAEDADEAEDDSEEEEDDD